MTESRATVYNRRAVESPSIRDDSDVSILGFFVNRGTEIQAFLGFLLTVM